MNQLLERVLRDAAARGDKAAAWALRKVQEEQARLLRNSARNPLPPANGGPVADRTDPAAAAASRAARRAEAEARRIAEAKALALGGLVEASWTAHVAATRATARTAADLRVGAVLEDAGARAALALEEGDLRAALAQLRQLRPAEWAGAAAGALAPAEAAEAAQALARAEAQILGLVSAVARSLRCEPEDLGELGAAQLDAIARASARARTASQAAEAAGEAAAEAAPTLELLSQLQAVLRTAQAERRAAEAAQGRVRGMKAARRGRKGGQRHQAQGAQGMEFTSDPKAVARWAEIAEAIPALAPAPAYMDKEVTPLPRLGDVVVLKRWSFGAKRSGVKVTPVAPKGGRP